MFLSFVYSLDSCHCLAVIWTLTPITVAATAAITCVARRQLGLGFGCLPLVWGKCQGEA